MKKTLLPIIGVILLITVISLYVFTGTIDKSAAWILGFGYGTAFAQEASTAKVVFKVACYDEGKNALQGLNGIRKIETGFHYLHETDTVYYDPKIITISDMESALKKAGTYVETITEKERN